MHRIIFAGQVQAGHDVNEVRESLGKMFRIDDPARLDRLFNGTAITLKRDLNAADARKYEAAIIKAGALVTVDPPLPQAAGQDTLAAATVHGRSLNMDTIVSSSSDALEAREASFDTAAEEVMAETRNQAASLAINTSGAGAGTAIPRDARGLSWGGFVLPWLWGPFNGTWAGLLGLLPVVQIGISIWLLIKGRQLAWQHKRWQSLEHFQRIQRNWSIAALVVLLANLLLVGIATKTVMDARTAMQSTLQSESDFEQALDEVDDPEMARAMLDLRAALEEGRKEAERYDARENSEKPDQP